jgi:hypothetical protein
MGEDTYFPSPLRSRKKKEKKSGTSVTKKSLCRCFFQPSLLFLVHTLAAISPAFTCLIPLLRTNVESDASHTHTHTHTQVDSYRYRKTTQKNPKQRKKWIPPYTGDALRSAQHSLRRCSTTGHSSDLRFSLSFPTSSPLLLCVIESPAFPAFVVHELVGGLSPQAFAGVYMHIFPSSLYQQVHCRETAT